MIVLYSGGGAGDFEFLSQALPDEDLDTLLFNMSQFLAARGEMEAVGYLATLKFELSEATNHFNDEFFVLHASIPLNQYLFFDEAVERREFGQIFENIASTVNKISDFYVRFVVCTLDQNQPPEKWREDLGSTVAALGSNQGLFTYRNNAKIVHAGLNFRSKTEVKIFDALVKSGVLVLPSSSSCYGTCGCI